MPGKEITTIRVGLRTGKSKTVEIDKPFDEIRSADVMKKVSGGIVGWVNVEDD